MLKVLKFEAGQNEFNFPRPNGAHEYITHLNSVIENLASYQAKLKSAVQQEKNDKDDINRDADGERYMKYVYIYIYIYVENNVQ